MKILQKSGFVIRHRYLKKLTGTLRKFWYSCLGMSIGKDTNLSKIYVTWPHKVYIGSKCNLEHDVYFKYDGIWQPSVAIHIDDNVFIGTGCEFNIRKSIHIGKNTLIASGCRFIDHDHGILSNALMRLQQGTEKEIEIGYDVWLGCNVIVLKGVTIGEGAIVAAGAVVTKSILPYEIWAGVPAKKISDRKQ